MDANTNASLDKGNSGNNTGKSDVATLPVFAEQLEGSLKTDKDVSQWLTNWKDKKLSDFVRDSYELGKSEKVLKGEIEGRVKIPGEKATPEDLAAYRKALNIPEKPDGYEFKRPEKLPDGMSYDETLEAKFRETVHGLGLTPKQAQSLFEMYNNYEISKYSDVTEIITKNRQAAQNELQKIWKGDEYKTQQTKATKAFYDSLKALQPPKELGGIEGIVKGFDESGFGDNPIMVWYFSKLFDKINIDSFGKTGHTGNASDNTRKTLDFTKSMGS